MGKVGDIIIILCNVNYPSSLLLRKGEFRRLNRTEMNQRKTPISSKSPNRLDGVIGNEDHYGYR